MAFGAARLGAAALKREEFSTEDEDLGRRQVQFNQAERTLIEEILWFVPTGTAGTSTRVPVKEALDTLHRLRDRWMTDPAPLAPLIAATEQIARYRPSLEIELRQWTQLVAESDGARTQRDPLSRAVLFLPLMRARGSDRARGRDHGIGGGPDPLPGAR